jgi:hypothetical protein
LVGEVDVCELDGGSYKLNQKFPASDGCNTCTCKISGDVECTELSCSGSGATCDEKYGCPGDAGIVMPVCDPKQGCVEDSGIVLGTPVCDPKYGCVEDSGIVLGTPVCDPKYGCADGGGGYPYCAYMNRIYRIGDSFRAEDGCNDCSCSYGGIQCTDKACYLPDAAVAPGTCQYAGMVYKSGDGFVADDDCNKCSCTETGVVACSRFPCGDNVNFGDAGSGVVNGGCTLNGKTYAANEWFDRGDNCNKCMCAADGTIQCTGNSCAPTGCTLGNGKLINFGQSVTCEDGCNTCTCDPKGGLSHTTRACAALPTVASCSTTMNPLAFPAPLVYVSGDAVAVTESRCVNGQSSDFSLCFEPISMATYEVDMYVVPSGVTHACSGTERVYSLAPVREAYNSATGQMSGKLALRGNGDAIGYSFGF